MDDLKGRQELYNGFGDTMTRGIELAVMPFLFGGIGFGLDLLLGTKPLLTIIFAVFAIVGLSVRTYYGYETAMRAHEAEMPWARRPTPAPADARPVAPADARPGAPADAGPGAPADAPADARPGAPADARRGAPADARPGANAGRGTSDNAVTKAAAL